MLEETNQRWLRYIELLAATEPNRRTSWLQAAAGRVGSMSANRSLINGGLMIT